ncbi:MAG: dynamin family protein [Thermodesulfobacteriota bacterium]
MFLVWEKTNSQPSFLDFNKLLYRIQEIAQQFQITSLNRQIEACSNILNQKRFIDVAIFGQFKAGKSSFLNCLIGKDVLPVGVIPVTTAITRLQYGEKERVIIHYYDGNAEEVPLERIEEYTAEACNPSNRKNVEMVDVELPCLEDFSGLRLVDTPGLGSIFKYHRETSANWLPEAGTAMVAISADRPLSENDLELIRDLREHTPRVILLLTKVDLLNDEQQQEIIQFFREMLRKELDIEPEIFPFSTRLNADKWKEKLHLELFAKISGNWEKEYRKILRHKMNSLLKNCLSYLEIAWQSSLQDEKDREALRQLILDEKVNFRAMEKEITWIARENSEQTRTLIAQRLERLAEAPLKKKLTEKLKQELATWKGNLWQLTRRYEEWLAENMREEMTRISQTEHRHFFGTLQKAHAGLSRSLDIFRSLLANNVEKVLGLKMAEAEWKIEIAPPTQPDIKISRTYDYHLDLIWFLIPMFIFRPLFEKHFLRLIPGEVFVNLSRLAAQWEERINKAIAAMQKQALSYVREEIATIESLLSKAQGRSEEIKAIIQELSAQLKSLEI